MSILRITAADGSARVVPLRGAELSIGRAATNAIVLEGRGVSAQHCTLVGKGPQWVIRDLGSTNGTYVNSERVRRATPLGEGDRIYVGPNLLQVLGPVDRGESAPARPSRLVHDPRWLVRVLERRGDASTSRRREPTRSSRGTEHRAVIARAGLILGGLFSVGLVLTATALRSFDADAGTPELDDRRPATKTEAPSADEPVLDHEPRRPPSGPRLERIEHELIPGETLAEVAQRYGVTVTEIERWNLLLPGGPGPQPGDLLSIDGPTVRPMPQQRIRYELEVEDTSWASLSKRFGLPVKKLRAYNPEVEDLRQGQEIVVWIEPKRYAPRRPRLAAPAFVADRRAQAIGSPNAGRLENGVQLPASPLYQRRYPSIMWGTGYLVANVQKAVAQFRLDMDFDGTLVMADISRKKGGSFHPPHKSHQAGRDIDIWLPTMRGVFKEKYLTEDGEERWGRRPFPEEVDWYATWGLISALVETGAVQRIFLSLEVQEKVYEAAKELGVGDEELDHVLQWPRGQGEEMGVVIDEPGHSRHMHVRFRCGKWERRCGKG